MSGRRNNNVRGPSSALTEFLKDAGINARTIARRTATREQEAEAATQALVEQQEEQPEAGPSRPATSSRPRRSTRTSGYASDNLDEPEEEAMEVDEKPSPTKKRKLTKAAEAKLKAQEKKKKGKKDSDDDDDDDTYTAPSRSLWASNGGAKPPVGNFEKCAICEKQFTVTKYTMAASSGKGYLCHQCAKAAGNDPFKKSAAPRKRKAPGEKRNVGKIEEKRLPTLANLCIQLITKHINDIEALGDIGAMNVEAIAKTLAKNRGLTPDNVHLFYNSSNSSLTLYDATNLPSPALETLAYLNQNLVSLRLDFCGHLDDTAFTILNKSLSALERIELLGPFLVKPAAWQTFFKSHPNLEGFLITQSPRFDQDCIESLVNHCTGLKDLRLKEVGKLDDGFLKQIQALKGSLRYLDLADPSHSCSDEAMIDLMNAVGGGLEYLNVSNHTDLTDDFLAKGLLPHVNKLESLTISYLPELTDKGVAEFFNSWTGVNPPLATLDASRNPELGDAALESVLRHSGTKLAELNINGWKDVSGDALNCIWRMGTALRRLDVGFCRAVDDFVVQALFEGEKDRGVQVGGCPALEELKIWGCNRVTSACPRKRGVVIHGIEFQTVR